MYWPNKQFTMTMTSASDDINVPIKCSKLPARSFNNRTGQHVPNECKVICRSNNEHECATRIYDVEIIVSAVGHECVTYANKNKYNGAATCSAPRQRISMSGASQGTKKTWCLTDPLPRHCSKGANIASWRSSGSRMSPGCMLWYSADNDKRPVDGHIIIKSKRSVYLHFCWYYVLLEPPMQTGTLQKRRQTITVPRSLHSGINQPAERQTQNHVHPEIPSGSQNQRPL